MSVPNGFKQTEVGVIPEDWDVVPIKNLILLMTNGFVGTVKSHYTTYEDGVLYIQGYNVKENGFNFNGIKSVAKEFHLKHKKSELLEGDLLTIQTGDVGVTAIIPKELEGANCHALIISRFIKKTTEPKFYCYYFNSKTGRRQLKEIETGSTMKHINVGHMKEINVPYPPPDEQTAIAAVLSDMDALIEGVEKLLEKKRRIKQGAMQELLTGKRRVSGFESQAGFQQTEVGVIPKDREVVSLGSLANIQRGASPRPINSPIWFDSNSCVGWLRISDVSKSRKYLYDTSQGLSQKGIEHSRFVKANNLIMSICATVGKPIILKKDVCIHDGFVVFAGCKLDDEYFYYLLQSIESKWSESGQTGSQMNLNTTLIHSTKISIPPTKSEQAAIAAILSDMDSEIEELETQLAKYRQLKTGMMQELLTGKKRLV